MERSIDRLRDIMRKLRAENGCPWDRKQTVDTLKPSVLEESYEVIDAIESGSRELLCEELGDLLMQIVFIAQICEEEKAFSFDDVAAGISDKLVRRHPHVFGDVKVADADEVVKNWNAIKQTEKAEKKSIIGNIPKHLPALQKAHHVQKRAAQAGFDWDEIKDVVAKLDEELAEVKEAMAAHDEKAIREELGDVLFSVVNVSRFLGHNAEDALNATVEKFIRRFHAVEKGVQEQGREMTDCTLAELDVFWDAAKDQEGTD
ncbi:MAG: nucleoside triphosphate pyrophosphohydrolase [Kiritimatiellia bacterium]